MTEYAVDNISKFGAQFQSKVIVSLMKDAGFLAQSIDVINKNFFESESSRWIVGKILDYYTQYKKPPTLEYFRAEITELKDQEVLKISVLEQLKSSHSHFTDNDLEYVQEKFLEFCKNQTLKNAILKSADLLQMGKYSEIKVLVDSAMKAGTQKDVGLMWSEDFESRHIHSARDTLPTGWPVFDKVLDGGLGPGELGTIMAPSGIGKSWALTHIGKSALYKGKKVVHYSFELNQNYQGIRYDTSISGIESSQLKHHLDEVKSMVETIPGKLVIKYFPARTATVHTLLAHIDYLKMIEFVPDLIIVDYADLMRPVTKGQARHEELQYVYEELRSMAGELWVPLWTASQSQRSSHNDEIIEADKVGESYGKVKTSDVLLSISRKTEDKINNTARCHLVKNRFGPDGVTFPAKLDTSRGLLEMYEYNSPEGEKLKQEMSRGEEQMKKFLADKLRSFEEEEE